MADVPQTKRIDFGNSNWAGIDLSNCENYDESHSGDSALIWLSSEEELPLLEQPTEAANVFCLVPQYGFQRDAIAGGGAQEQQPCVASLPADPFYTASDIQVLSDNKPGKDSVAECFVSSPLTYRASAQFVATKWLLRVAALVVILLIGSELPSILEHVRPRRVKASATVGGEFSVAPGTAGSTKTVRVLTVMAGREETVKEISLRFVGRFDDHLLQEISRLNPDLKDPDHLEDGQLIRIPLRPRPPLD